MSDRYKGKPLLILIEDLVLYILGELDARRQQALNRLEPELSALYQRPGTWHEIIRAELELDQSFDQSVRRSWEFNKERALGVGVVLKPIDFAKAVADTFVPQDDSQETNDK